MILYNPIIPGFYPDPSICRVGGTYYLACSTLEYYPGFPIFYSRDLVHWKQITYAFGGTGEQLLSYEAEKYELYAPTLRHHGGLFYLISTNILGGGHFIITASKAEGPWSKPVWIKGDGKGDGHDPDLFFDDDGQVYFSRFTWDRGIVQWKLDLDSGRVLSEGKTIWKGFEDRYCECPHLYRKDDWYYLLAAEGSTGLGHMVVCARSKKPDGPFEGCPNNPILSHRALVLETIKCVGHGDLTVGPDGKWWMVFLGTRQNLACGMRVLGRETYLAPVDWDEDGWPVVNYGRPIRAAMECDRTLPEILLEGEPNFDDFNDTVLSLCWSFHYPPKENSWSLSDCSGWLTLYGQAGSLDDGKQMSMVVRRQRSINFQAKTRLSFEPEEDGEEAGITAFASGYHHYETGILQTGGKKVLFWRKRIGDLAQTMVICELQDKGAGITLAIRGDDTYYELGYSGDVDEDICWCQKGLAKYLATEVAGSSDGVFIGMYATGNGRCTKVPGRFDWFLIEQQG